MNERKRLLDHPFIRSLLKFVVAWALIIGPGVMFGIGMNAVRFYNGPKMVYQVKEENERLPRDVPLYEGANLTSQDSNGDDKTFDYEFSLATLPTLKEFYKKAMTDEGWHEYAISSTVFCYYKKEGRRQATLKFKYFAGRSTLTVHVTDNGDLIEAK